jgi:hypothetical protein
MIPYLLAAVGGYLIGQSRKDEQFADGGMMADGGIVYLDKENDRVFKLVEIRDGDTIVLRDELQNFEYFKKDKVDELLKSGEWQTLSGKVGEVLHSKMARGGGVTDDKKTGLQIRQAEGKWVLTAHIYDELNPKFFTFIKKDDDAYDFENFVKKNFDTKGLQFDSESGMFLVYGNKTRLMNLLDELRNYKNNPAIPLYYKKPLAGGFDAYMSYENNRFDKAKKLIRELNNTEEVVKNFDFEMFLYDGNNAVRKALKKQLDKVDKKKKNVTEDEIEMMVEAVTDEVKSKGFMEVTDTEPERNIRYFIQERIKGNGLKIVDEYGEEVSYYDEELPKYNLKQGRKEDGGMMKKGGSVKNKKWIQDALTGDEGSLRRTAKRKGLLRGDENLSMTDLKKLQKMGGKTGKRAHLAQTLRKFDKGGMEDYYEDLRVYVQGVGTIYQGNSLAEATDVFDEYYDNNPHAEMVMVDEKYGDEIKWANVSNEYDDED